MNISKFAFFVFFFQLSYVGQGVFYDVGSNYAKIGQFIYYLISLYCIVMSVSKGYFNLKINISLILFLILNSVYFIFNPNGINEIYFAQFRTIFFCISTYFIFYYLGASGLLDEYWLKIYFLLLLIISIINYFVYAQQADLNEFLQNNAIYAVVMLLPFLFLFKNRVLILAILTLLILFILTSIKRGAVITSFFISIMVVIYIFNSVNKSSRNKKIIKKIFLFILVILISYFILDFFLKSDMLISRFQGISEDGGSSRDVIFIEILKNGFQGANFINFLFGYGFVGSMKFAFGGTAHNDLLEVLSNFGIFGIFIFISIWYNLWRLCINKFILKRDKYILFTILFVWIIDSQYQQVYNSIHSFSLMMLLGFILGSIRNNKNLVNRNLI